MPFDEDRFLRVARRFFKHNARVAAVGPSMLEDLTDFLTPHGEKVSTEWSNLLRDIDLTDPATIQRADQLAREAFQGAVDEVNASLADTSSEQARLSAYIVETRLKGSLVTG